MGELRVVAAANRDKDGVVFSLPPPARHHNINWLMQDQGRSIIHSDLVQGFLLSDGRFVGRREAKKIAVACGQQISRHMDLDELYSEDVW